MSLERKVALAAVDAAIDPEEDQCNCELNAKTWPNVLTGLGLGAGVGMVIAGVSSFSNLPVNPSQIVLNLYLIVLGAFSCCAEARRFKLLRNLIYHVVQHAYFITNYTARAVFYVFMATIIFDDSSLLLMIIAIFVAAVGLVTFVINAVYKLPVHLEKPELRKLAEAKIRQEVEAKYLAEEAARQNRFGPTPIGGGQPVPTPSQNLLNERDRREQQEREKSQIPLQSFNSFDASSSSRRGEQKPDPQVAVPATQYLIQKDFDQTYSPPQQLRFQADRVSHSGNTPSSPSVGHPAAQDTSTDPFRETKGTDKR